MIFAILVSCQLKRVDATGSSNSVNNLNSISSAETERVEETDSLVSLHDKDDLQLNLIGNGAGMESGDEDRQHYTHQWAAHIVGGKSVADRIARKHGFINGGEVRGLIQ